MFSIVEAESEGEVRGEESLLCRVLIFMLENLDCIRWVLEVI